MTNFRNQKTEKESNPETQKNRNKPATIRRPGADTKVGGLPLTTIGFDAVAAAAMLPLLEEEASVSASFLECEEGGRGNEFIQSEAIL